jgi:hypothetical protein
MAVTKINATTRQSMANAVIAQIDAGTGPATLKFYTGTMPATPETAIGAQVLLGTLTCSDPSATTTAGVITFAAITQDSSADASGTAAWARLADSAGVAVMDFDVTNTAGTGAIKINTTTIVSGGPIAMDSFTITMPGA